MRLVYVLDCGDPETLADFWTAALGLRRERFHPPYLCLVDPAGRWPDLLLQRVPEPKSGKNRMHLDIQVVDAAAAAQEVRRLSGLGAAVLVEPHDDDGYLTTVLADPQGNEFCVIAPPAGSRGWRQLTAAPDWDEARLARQPCATGR
jgi:catechol 2,3-dioxygenase-like lactoylglutathione lyase family enzyme